jgi:DNA polymerase-3 subunit delta
LLYLLIGEDDFSLHESFEAIKKGLGDTAMLDTNTTVLEGQQVSPEQLKVVAETVPFLADKRFVIVNSLLERFAPGARAKGKGKADDYKTFSAALGNVPPSTVVVMVDHLEVKFKRDKPEPDIEGIANPLLKELMKVGEVRTFPMLRKPELNRWIQERIIKDGGTISDSATRLLSELVGNDLWTMSNEVDKLVSFTAGRRIEEADVRTLVSSAQETSVFALVDAVMAARADVAQQLLRQQLMDGAAPAQLMVMLARQLQLIVRAKDLKSQGKADGEIQTILKLGWGFQLRKALEQANRYSMTRLKEIYEKLLETDMAIKTGKLEPELALNLLVAELCLQRART